MNLCDALFPGTNDNDAVAILLSPQSSLTFQTTRQCVLQHASWLAQKQVQKVVFVSDNTVDFILSVLACCTAQNNILPFLVNVRWSAREIIQALPKDAIDLILYSPRHERVAKVTAQQLNIPLLAIPSFARLYWQSDHKGSVVDEKVMHHQSAKPPPPQHGNRVLSRNDAVIVFTSGTTSGVPKGVRLSHDSLYLQCQAKLRAPCGYDPSTRLLANTVPFYHIGGLSSVLAVWLGGGTIVLNLHESAVKFEPSATLHSLQNGVANTLVVVPAMLVALRGHYGENVASVNVTYRHVRLVLIGGQSASPPTLTFCRTIFPNARLVQTFACTEAASSLTFLDVTRPTNNYDSTCVGKPPSHIELALFNENKKKIDASNTIGRIATRGRHVMNGYYGHKDSHPLNIWLVTNDLGKWNNGQLHFCGRRTDSIRTGGETVLAAEVERVVLQHSSVVECAVFALPDERLGEAVCCAIVGTINPHHLRDFCKMQGLAGYKIPRRVFLVSELPRNASGKVLKFRLVERFGTPASKL